MKKFHLFRFSFLTIALSIFIAVVPRSYSASVVPNDGPYEVYDDDSVDYRFIYKPKDRDKIEWLTYINKKLTTIFQKEFNWKLDEKTALVFASQKNQVSNAFATNFPNLTTVFFRGGLDIVDLFSVRSWPFALVSHETAHLYQINPKQGLAKIGHKIFGNNVVGFIPFPIPADPLTTFPLPFFTNPNNLLPTWIIEGNAVFNESRFGNGGRLYSGHYRAMFNSLIHADKLTVERLTNEHNEFPFTTEKYISGGYIFLYLAGKYSIQSANDMFYKHSLHYFNPFDISNTFAKNFSNSYRGGIEEALEFYRKSAKEMKFAQGKTLGTSISYYPLNRSKKSIYFLSNPDGLTSPELNVYNIPKKKFRSRKFFVPGGKLFRYNGKYYSAASFSEDNDRTTYSLYKEESGRLKKFDDKLIYEIIGKNVLYADAKKSFHSPHLFLGKTSFGEVNSSAILDEKNNPIYFKQDAKRRTLYRGRKALFTYEGYYGRPADIDRSGGVYFIGPTKYGSGLFFYKSGKVERVSDSDAIVDAKIVGKNKFLITEINSNYYEYKIIEGNLNRRATPFAYKYYFEKDKHFEFMDKVALKKSSIGKSIGKGESYNSIGQLRYSAWQLSYLDAGDGGITDVSVQFADPLDFNFLSLNVNDDQRNKEREIQLVYRNDRYLLDWQLLLDHVQFDAVGSRKKSEEYSGALFFGYPLLNHRTWFLNPQIGGGVEKVKSRSTSDPFYYASMRFSFIKDFRRAFDVHRFWESKLEYLVEEEGDTKSLFSAFKAHLGHEAYFTIEGIYNLSDAGTLEVGEPILFDEGLVSFSSVKLSTLAGIELKSYRIGTSLKKVLNWAYYNRWLPIGIRRIAPKLIGNYISYGFDFEESYFENGVGSDVELIIAHNIVLDVEVKYLNKTNAINDQSLGITFKGDF